MNRSTPQSERHSRHAALLAFVGTTWFALLPLIVGWNAMLEGGDPGVGLGILSWLAIAASPIVGWAFAKNITELGVEHAQRPALAAAILVGAIWAGGLYVHLTGALWLVKCKTISDADACLAAGNYFDSGEAAFQGTIDAKQLWADACEGGGEHGWKACRKIVHRVGYRELACASLSTHCNADDRNMGACWDWSVVCNRADYVDDDVDERAASKDSRPTNSSKLRPKPRASKHTMPSRAEQVADYERCLEVEAHGLLPECDRTLDRGILSQREAVCTKVARDCSDVGSWACRFTQSRCELLAASPYR
jgi:hypothetical protein